MPSYFCLHCAVRGQCNEWSTRCTAVPYSITTVWFLFTLQIVGTTLKRPHCPPLPTPSTPDYCNIPVTIDYRCSPYLSLLSLSHTHTSRYYNLRKWVKRSIHNNTISAIDNHRMPSAVFVKTLHCVFSL